MFDYTSLILRVRRLIGDTVQSQIDIEDESESDSYYILLSQDAWCTPVASGVVLNGVPISSDNYTVTKNVIRMDTLVDAGTNVFVQYDYVSNTDADITNNLADSISTIEGIFNTDFEFGVAPATSDTETAQDIPSDLQTLFCYQAAVLLLGLAVIEAGDDAIYIKDGDTVINTAVSSSEKGKGYHTLLTRWQDLLRTVQTNRFEGVTMT
jgi:hypothetical protein